MQLHSTPRKLYEIIHLPRWGYGCISYNGNNKNEGTQRSSLGSTHQSNMNSCSKTFISMICICLAFIRYMLPTFWIFKGIMFQPLIQLRHVADAYVFFVFCSNKQTLHTDWIIYIIFLICLKMQIYYMLKMKISIGVMLVCIFISQ